MVTFAPLMEQDDIQFAALGLRNMLNGGGAILACSGLRSAAVSPASVPECCLPTHDSVLRADLQPLAATRSALGLQGWPSG